MSTGNIYCSTEIRVTTLPPLYSPTSKSSVPKPPVSLTFLNSKFSLGDTYGTMQMKKIKLLLEGVPESLIDPIIRIQIDCTGDKNVINSGNRSSVEIKVNKADNEWSPADSPAGFPMTRRGDSSFSFEPYCQFTHQTIISDFYKNSPASGPIILSFFVDGLTGIGDTTTPRDTPLLITKPVNVIRQRVDKRPPANPASSSALPGPISDAQDAESLQRLKKRCVAGSNRPGMLQMSPTFLSPSPFCPMTLEELELVRYFNPFPSEIEQRILWQPLVEWTIVHYDFLFRRLQEGFLRVAEAGRLGQYQGANLMERCVAKFLTLEGKSADQYQHCSDLLRECERDCIGSIDKSHTHCVAAFKADMGVKSDMMVLIELICKVGAATSNSDEMDLVQELATV